MSADETVASPDREQGGDERKKPHQVTHQHLRGRVVLGRNDCQRLDKHSNVQCANDQYQGDTEKGKHSSGGAVGSNSCENEGNTKTDENKPHQGQPKIGVVAGVCDEHPQEEKAKSSQQQRTGRRYQPGRTAIGNQEGPNPFRPNRQNYHEEESRDEQERPHASRPLVTA